MDGVKCKEFIWLLPGGVDPLAPGEGPPYMREGCEGPPMVDAGACVKLKLEVALESGGTYPPEGSGNDIL